MLEILSVLIWIWIAAMIFSKVSGKAQAKQPSGLEQLLDAGFTITDKDGNKLSAPKAQSTPTFSEQMATARAEGQRKAVAKAAHRKANPSVFTKDLSAVQVLGVLFGFFIVLWCRYS